MYLYTWYQWLAFFFIYCFFGWVFESTYVSLKKRRFINRGFLRLPMLPLYGTGAVMMLWASLPVKDNLVLVYLVGVIAATVLEYVTGSAMERLFKMKYWDYSNQPFNLRGYVCLSSSVAWGFLTIFLTEFIHNPIERTVIAMNPVFIIVVVVAVGALFISDAIVSTKQALDLGRLLESMTKMKADLEEIQLQMALMKAETVQKVIDLKDDNIQWAAGIKGETSLKLFSLRKEMAFRIAKRTDTHTQKITSSLAELNVRLKTLGEARQRLSGHLNFYRKELLRGNPTASSKQFNEALKELKEALENKRK